MKIAIDARELRTSTGRYVERLLHYLQLLDQAHDYYVLLKPADLDGWHPSNLHFHKVACPHKEFTFAEQLSFKKQLDDLQADLVHFPMIQQPVQYHGTVVTTIQDLTTLRFRNPTKNPLVFTAKQQIYKRVTKRVAQKSAAIITPTQFVKDDIVRFSGINPDKITVTYEAADEFSEQAVEISSLLNKQFIMYNGRPQPHKNLRRLIEAFAVLHNRRQDLYLMIAGKKDGSHESYAALAQRLGVNDRVVFTDWISDGQLKWAMQHTAAYVWPSLSEGFGLPPLEAMLHGAPVVSSNASCMPEVLGSAAHYFDPFDVTQMSDAIDEVLTDKVLRQKLITAGKAQVTKYSWRRMSEQTLDVYRQVLGES
jgi:glycosyltransferase involved in cell wall biosynthesis